MREMFSFRLDTLPDKKDGQSTQVDVILTPPFMMHPVLDEKAEIGTQIVFESGYSIKVKQVREAIYKMDKWQIFKKANF